MPVDDIRELKQFLVGKGFEAYRTLQRTVVLAERVRENLILDSGVSATVNPLGVSVTLRAQASQFAALTDEQLYGILRDHAAELRARGYSETSARAVPVHDPGDKATVLDTWFELEFERPSSDHQELVSELRFALALERTLSGRG
jgi:hypothetical protein